MHLLLRVVCDENVGKIAFATFERESRTSELNFSSRIEKPQKETFLCFYPCLYKKKRICNPM